MSLWSFLQETTQPLVSEQASRRNSHVFLQSPTAPGDYVSSPTTTLTFSPGETSQTVTVATVGDSVFEEDETFTGNLQSPSPSGSVILGMDEAEAIIVNDDGTATTQYL